jgi:flavin reductase (DIM6/NTAB) family NADH-FMN oxidoreductase RutF
MRKEIGFFDVFHKTLDNLQGEGIILVAGNPPNPMTIGWGTLGEIWRLPVFIVLVRPTRYTFQLMENSTTFTVCVFPEGFSHHIALCGSRSGRDTDKIKLCGFTMEPGIRIPTPFIAESTIHYECRIIHKNRLDPNQLDPSIIKRYYPAKDWHMVYYGEIKGVFTDLRSDD